MVTSDIARDAAIDRLGQAIDTSIQHDPDDLPARLSSNTDDHVTVYSTLTGGPKQILLIDRRRVLSKTLPNGEYAHWAEGMPGEAPLYVKGEVMCMLHPEFDEADGAAGFTRDYIDHAGLTGRTCNMMAPDKNNVDNFKSVYARDRHMEQKHPVEWDTIKAALVKDREDREQVERKEDRAAMLALAGTAAGAQPVVAPEPVKEVVHFICDVEGCGSELGTDIGLVRHKRTTMDAAHRQARGEAE